jgi:predicted outer membrane repeat protein
MLFLLFSFASAAQLNVGGDLPLSSLREAIAVAEDGDELVLEKGVYRECVDLAGKDLIINGGEHATVDAEGRCPFVLVADAGEKLSVIGLVLRNQGKGGISAQHRGTRIKLHKVMLDGFGASRSKGALYAVGATLDIRESRFTGNSSEKGGALWLEKGAFAEVVDSLFSENRAQIGAAIYAFGDVELNLTGSRFTGNKTLSGGMGGAVALRSNSILNGDKLHFQNNHAQGKGGAVYAEESSSQKTCRIRLRDSTLQGNSASFGSGAGGGIYARNSVDVRLERVRFVDNQASTSGGGLFLYDIGGEVVISGSEFRRNKARSGSGGGISAAARGADRQVLLKISDTLFKENSASIYGGGLSLGDTIHAVGGLELRNTVFEANTASSSQTGAGGGVYSNLSAESKVLVEGGRFTRNRTEISAGGLYINGAGSVEVIGTVFEGNEAAGVSNVQDRYGGGLMVARAQSLRVDGASFCGNRVAHKGASGPDSLGGAVYLQEIATSEVGGSRFWANRSDGKGGAVAVSDVGSFTLVGSTVVANLAEDGGGVWLQAGESTIANTVFAYGQTGGSIRAEPFPEVLSHNDFYANTGGGPSDTELLALGVGNVSSKPGFVKHRLNDSCSDDDLGLQPTSVLRGSGDPAFGKGASIGAP